MTESHDEHGDRLRRVLRAEAEAAVPAADGLERIRGRIQANGSESFLWWRPVVSLASAVMVAGAVVMSVPSLRERATPAQDQVSDTSQTSSYDNLETISPGQPPIMPAPSGRPTPGAPTGPASTAGPTPDPARCQVTPPPWAEKRPTPAPSPCAAPPAPPTPTPPPPTPTTCASEDSCPPTPTGDPSPSILGDTPAAP